MEKKRFTNLYNTYSKRLYNYALWMTHNVEASEDIIQSVFIKVWQHTAVPRQENEVEPWLYAITRNKCLDYFRKCSRFTRFRLRFAHETVPEAFNNAENKFPWDMLGALHEEERSILYLHMRAGYSYKEIAKMFASNENAIRIRAFRAISKLRKVLIKEHV